MNEPIRLLQDNDGHWYAVPDSQTEAFWKLLDKDEIAFEDQFSSMRLDMSLSCYTFTGMQVGR